MTATASLLATTSLLVPAPPGADAPPSVTGAAGSIDFTALLAGGIPAAATRQNAAAPGMALPQPQAPDAVLDPAALVLVHLPVGTEGRQAKAGPATRFPVSPTLTALSRDEPPAAQGEVPADGLSDVDDASDPVVTAIPAPATQPPAALWAAAVPVVPVTADVPPPSAPMTSQRVIAADVAPTGPAPVAPHSAGTVPEQPAALTNAQIAALPAGTPPPPPVASRDVGFAARPAGAQPAPAILPAIPAPSLVPSSREGLVLPAIDASPATARPAAVATTPDAAGTPHALTATRPQPASPALAQPAAVPVPVVLPPEPAARVFADALHRAAADERSAPDPVPAPVTAPVAMAVATVGDAHQPSLDMGQRGWPAAMMRHIEQLRDMADANDTRIRLVPDALGTIDVSLKREGETVHVELRAEQQQTRALIAQEQPRLTELAEQRGLKLQTGGGGSFTGGGQQAAGGEAQRQPPRAPTPAAHRRHDADDRTTDERVA